MHPDDPSTQLNNPATELGTPSMQTDDPAMCQILLNLFLFWYHDPVGLGEDYCSAKD